MYKVGIVTTYDELNFGAYLQAYSLQKYIELIGCDVEFINYKSYEYWCAEFKATYRLRRPVNFINTIRKSMKFSRALKRLKVSKKYKKLSQIDPGSYDLIIYGSDEIWNINNCLGGVVDMYYFGEGVSTNKCSYAASFGSTEFIPDDKVEISNSLLEFKSIAVRDKNSEDVINLLGRTGVVKVLDPTFLIEQPVPERTIRSKYIFYYSVSRNKSMEDELCAFSSECGVEVISFGYQHDKFKSLVNIDPFEWLSFLKYAEYVVTDMYHGTIFSIKYKKNFIVDLTEYRENKLGDLLNTFELRSKLYRKGHLNKIFNAEFDYADVFKIKELWTESSRKYLSGLLK